MFHFFNSQTRAFVTTTCIFLILLFSFSPIVNVDAGEMPDKEQLTQQITSEAMAEINGSSNNNSDSSSKADNTGDDVKVSESSSSNSQTTVSNNNSATVNQVINAEANTGNNEASRNISFGGDAGVITTGNATTNTVAVVNANNSTTAISGSGGTGSSGSTSVTNTGSDSTFNTNNQANTTTAVTNNGTVTISQAANTVANTGNNVADRNISFGGNAGVITTGTASNNTSFLVSANNNKTVMLVGGAGGNGPGSGASIYILNTGNQSQYYGMSSLAQNAVVTNSNSAAISQSCGNVNYCSADTGGNSSDRGIAFGGDAGVINTGDATVNLAMFAQANKNYNYLGLGGMLLGQSGQAGQMDVVNTGDDSSFSNQSSSETSVAVNNNNYANVNQTANAYANTGNNTANRNISFGGDAGVINTGDATVNVAMVADVNNNKTVIKDENAGGYPSPSPTTTPSPSPTPLVSPSPSPSVSPSPSPTATPTPTPSPTPKPKDKHGKGNHHWWFKYKKQPIGGVVKNEYNFYYYPSSSTTEINKENNNPIQKAFDTLAEAVGGPGQVLAATTGPGCEPCSATAFTGQPDQLPAWHSVLKGVMLLSVGYGLATVKGKIPKYVGIK